MTALNITSEGLPWKPLVPAGPQHGLPGRLVVLEGVDASGKSTLISRLLKHCEESGVTARFVRVPTTGLREYPMWLAWADESRGVPEEHIDGYGLSVMALGDRLVLQRSEVLPALAEGAVVVCDRYILSSLIYESSPVHDYVLSKIVAPDLGVYVDADAETVLARLAERDYEKVHSRDAEEKPLLIERYRTLAGLHGYVPLSTVGRSVDESFDELLRLLGDHDILPAVSGR
ncbi:dTMP kinase [Streptomyces sp. NPDC059168]|uniref:dTMP kinase n=1 Tax=Streptomyces sp. NPDC059168 TaxID=3346753 RepID=UPI00368663B3